jgi:hypothetical protein
MVALLGGGLGGCLGGLEYEVLILNNLGADIDVYMAIDDAAHPAAKSLCGGYLVRDSWHVGVQEDATRRVTCRGDVPSRGAITWYFEWNSRQDGDSGLATFAGFTDGKPSLAAHVAPNGWITLTSRTAGTEAIHCEGSASCDVDT